MRLAAREAFGSLTSPPPRKTASKKKRRPRTVPPASDLAAKPKINRCDENLAGGRGEHSQRSEIAPPILEGTVSGEVLEDEAATPRRSTQDDVFRAALEEAIPDVEPDPRLEAVELPMAAAPPIRRTCSECGEPAAPERATCSDACQAAARKRGISEAAEAKRRRTRAAADGRGRAEGLPFPVAAETALSVERVDREQDCTHYDDCLDLASRLDWPGWSCSECPIRGTCSTPADEALEAATWGGTSIAAQLAESRTQQSVIRMRRTGLRRLSIGGREL